MASTTTHFLFLLYSISLPLVLSSPSTYLSPHTFLLNYQNMLTSFKIFIYTSPDPLNFSTRPESIFFTSLLGSPFLTPDPEQAHLFLVPFPSNFSRRSISHLLQTLRSDLPFWNRSLGADHVFLSCDGIEPNADRNLVELRKNSVQISCLPAQPNRYIPHKDITLPPIAHPHQAIHSPGNDTWNYLVYVKYGAVMEKSLVDEMVNDGDFLVEQEPSDLLTYEWSLTVSKFCLFEYGEGDMSGISDAVRFGCVPLVITERPMQDLPLMDLLRWQDMALFVKKENGGVKALRRVLDNALDDEKRYEEMRESCVAAGKHFVWNEKPQPLDAFHSVMYQLWTRRHAIRYADREFA